MIKQIAIWNLIIDSIKNDIPVMLLYVLESKGSSPGRQGFFMAVNATGSMEGSIGGGIMEHKFVEMTKEKLRVGNSDPGVKKQIHDKIVAKNQSGMICSGEQTVLFYPVKKADQINIEKIVESLEGNKNGILRLSSSGISFNEGIPEFNYSYQYKNDDSWTYEEKTGYKNKLFIIGGGHCSLALSNLMRELDFYITVIDERDGLKTMEANRSAHQKHLVDSYTEIGRLVETGMNTYVVIMTFGYRTDDIALKALLDKQFRYLGVLGSKKKMETLFENYRNGGISEALLQRIHTPIGLDISSQTPEEIAVSIGAQLIKVKNQQP